MHPTSEGSRDRSSTRSRIPRLAAQLAAVCLVVVLLAALTGCSLPWQSEEETPAQPAPTPTATAAATATSVGPVWATVGMTEIPLFSLLVTEAPGFNKAEQRYLRGLKVTWAKVRGEATQYSKLTDTGADKKRATKLVAKIDRQSSKWADESSPSTRFSDFTAGCRELMDDVVQMSELTRQFNKTKNAEKKTSLANKMNTIASALNQAAHKITVRGVHLRNNYGGLPPMKTPSPSASAAPTTIPTSEPTSGGSTPTPKPTKAATNSLSKPEIAQIEDLEELDTWLRGILDDDAATMEQPLPWTADVVEAFVLDMGFIQDECDAWIATKAAGTHVATAYKQYINGLKLVKEATEKLILAARNADATALADGKAKLDEADPYLTKGIAKLKSLL